MQHIGANTGRIAAVADRENIIAISGAPKRELMDKPNSQALEKLMEQRRNYRYAHGENLVKVTEESDKYHLAAASPILSQGDLMGCVMLLMADDNTPLPEGEQKLVQTVAGFLGKQMES